MVYIPGSLSIISGFVANNIEAAENEVLGKGTGMGGTAIIKVTFNGDVISVVKVVSHNETPGKSDPA